MKYFRNIFVTVMIVWLLVACVGRDNINLTELSRIGGNEPVLIADSIPSEENIDLMFMQEQNYILTDYDTTANILNIVNISRFRELICCQEAMDDLAVDNFAILPDTLPQLFQVYQRNDSLQIPNFVTTDLFVQLSHIYETYVLQTVEERYFSPLLTELCLAMYNASIDQANKSAREDIKDLAARNAAFYAIPYNLLTGKSLKIPGDYQAAVEQELAYITQQEDRRPALLGLKTAFAYSDFKPYGHYTLTAGLRRYFRAWKWLQSAPYCSSDKSQLQQAVLLASALQTSKTKSGVAAIDIYSRLCGAMDWFVGKPAYCSLLDVALLLKKERVANITAALDAKMLSKVSAAASQMSPNAASGNTSAMKHAVACRNGIYFLPQPARMDDEILHAITDPTPDAQRAFPELSDVFAALKSKSAFDKWNISSYNKRLECLLAMQQKPASAPSFARKQAWNRKKLETASASWVKLKHDVLLYGVIPDHPEPLNTAAASDTLSAPATLGYVEPALPFWTKLREWVELTDETLEKYQMTTDTLDAQTERLHRYVALMETAAQKELDYERLDNDTYRFIAYIGDSIEQLTLSMVTPEIDRWAWTAGTDKSISVFENVYRRNVAGCPKNGVLCAATSNVNNLYVVVEIDGNLYLTKGAAFKYDYSIRQ